MVTGFSAVINGGNLIQRNLEHVGCGFGMNVNGMPESLQQALFIRHVRQHPQLNLRIIGSDQNIALTRQKRLADFTRLFITDADVLQTFNCF